MKCEGEDYFDSYTIKLRNMKILIIDDDGDDTLILSDALDQVWPAATYEIISTRGPWRNHFQTKDTVPNIIFVDAFPLIGKACLTQLNSLSNGRNIKIIVYTDESRPIEIDEFMRLGANQILLKTDNYTELKLSLAALKEEYMDGINCRVKHIKIPADYLM